MLLAVLLAGATFCLGQTPKDRRIEDEIRRLNKQEVEALLRNDVSPLKLLWSDDFVVTNPFNTFVNKQQVLQMIQSGLLGFSSYQREIEYVRVYGDTVLVAGRETVGWAGKLPTSGTTSHLRFTGIWMKQSGRWQQVARHANIVVQP